MILYNNTYPRGHDEGPHQNRHGNEVSILARLDIARPMPEGKSWHDTDATWLHPERERRSTPRRAPVIGTVICFVCEESFSTTHPHLAKTCSARCRQRARRQRLAAA